MIVEQRVLELLQESFDSLHRAGLMKHETKVNGDTVLLGNGSTLDSIAFVTLVADFEDRIDRENGQPIYIVLTDIHEFNPSKSSLSAGTLAQYIATRAGE
jgi:acyl carrier protein